MTIKRYYLVESPEDCPCWGDCYTTAEGVHICRKAHIKCEDSNKFPQVVSWLRRRTGQIMMTEILWTIVCHQW